MLIKSGQEALFVAIEMERSAVQIYERALMLTDPEDETHKSLRQQLMIILSDEQQHLAQFQGLYHGLEEGIEQQLMLSAVASTVLFEGGLMGAVRQGMLKDKQSLIDFAKNAEKKAAATYRSFAEMCEDRQTANILRSIANEEDRHLHTLRNYM
ncbi:MAG: ferritin-like domain-containing protein [Firmicutes bacterium]|nr:ferritin-like domain-containing protein [Bacillota bacterium]